ncbi:MAG: DnaD domain protein [Hominimerdicola sp.]
MEYNFDIDRWGSFFMVPTSVVNDYIRLSDGSFVKVLLCILASSKRQITSNELAQISGLSEDICDDAVTHWVSLGVISTGSEVKQTQTVATVKHDVNAEPVSTVEAVKPENKPTEKKIIVTYSQKEIREKAEKDENLKQLINDIQGVLKFSINGKELGRLVELYEFYHFDVPTILLVAEYCAQMGKRSVAYLSAVLIRWYEQDITSYADVEAEIIRCTEEKSFESKCMRIFGMESKPSKQQRELMDKWYNIGFNSQMLEIAYNKCMDATGKLTFKYIDSILMKWAGKSITTPEQVQIDDSNFRMNNSKKYQKSAEETPKKTSYDLDEFEQFALNFNPNKRGGA